VIYHEIRNLRSPDWHQSISKQDLLEMMRKEDSVWTCTPWQQHRCYSSPMRSFIVTSEEGDIYAIWIRKAERHE